MPSPAASAPLDQSRYQVRLDWSVTGLARLAPSDVVVVVDALEFSSGVSARVAAGEAVGLGEADPGVTGAADAVDVVRAAAASGALVLVGCLRNAAAVADAILAEQSRRAARTSIAVIPVGEAAEAGLRVTVEDLLAAGAVIDALSSRGVDHTSPEAAAACESFRGLRGAVRHLITASGSGQRLLEDDRREVALAAAAIDADAVAPVLRDGKFVAA